MPIQEIGKLLLSHKVITKEQLDFALMIQKNTSLSQRIGRILKYYNFATDEQIAKALARQVGWRYFNKRYVVNLPVIEKIGLDFLIDRVFIPVETRSGLAFVFAYPFDVEATDFLSHEGLRDKELYIGSETAIRYHLDLLNKQRKQAEIEKKIRLIRQEGLAGGELKELLDELLDQAIIRGATDIHVEPEQRISAIRFRIDGILHLELCIPLEVHNNLINVVFSKAEITVSDFFRFHDARFQHDYCGQAVDIRVSCIPSIFGPTLVLRLLNANKTLIALENLGFCNAHLEAISRTAQKPHGIVIITGPTGSGKTTTLYAILNQLKSISSKVITIEDPVEIKMPLINQVQINEKQGITFAQATRAFLRHDPNIILIGEIRDADTAREAIRAAITGHRVFSTLHTNSAVDSVYRLHDLGIELSHLANSILCVISQRLIRKLCVFCRRKVTAPKEGLPEFLKQQLNPDAGTISVYKARGCLHCQQGYRGRTVIAEVLQFSEDIRDMIAQGRLDYLRHKTRQRGFVSLQQDAARLVLEGITSAEEAERIAG